MHILTIIYTKENVYDMIQMEKTEYKIKYIQVFENKFCKEMSIYKHQKLLEEPYQNGSICYFWVVNGVK